METRQLFDRETSTYTYLLFDEENREGVLIDGVKEQFERDLKLIKDLRIKLKYIFDTHVHADHITSAGMFRDATGAKTVVSESALVECANINAKDGDTFQFGRYEIKALATPGHTEGCMSYYVSNDSQGFVFSGDALLIQGNGRTDFQQGNPGTLYESITQKLFTLPDDTVLYPGHDYKGMTSSTIGEEKTLNPRIGKEKTKEECVSIMDNLMLPKPQKIDVAVPANQSYGFASSVDPEQKEENQFEMNDLYSRLYDLTSDELMLDIRTPEEYKAVHIEGSMNIPSQVLREHVEELKTYKQIFLYCRSGQRAQNAVKDLRANGIENLVCICNSGMQDWVTAGYPVIYNAQVS